VYRHSAASFTKRGIERFDFALMVLELIYGGA
jgi:hypothetical protein